MTLGSEPAFSLRAYEDAVARGQAADATLEVVVRCLASLRVAEERTTVERLQRQAVHALEARGVRPRRSRAGRVYVDVHRAAADAATRRGDAFARAWCELLALDCEADVGEPDARVLAAASDALCADLWSVREPAPPLAAATSRATNDGSLSRRPPPAASDLRALRLSGAQFEVLAAVEGEATRTGLDAEDVAWQGACARMHLCADTAPVREHLTRWEAALAAAPEVFQDRRAWVALYAHSEPKKFAAERTAEWLPERRTGLVTEAVEQLGALREVDTPMHLRLLDGGQALSALADKVRPLELQLAFLSGMARWLVQAKRPTFVRVVLDAYRRLSRRASRGACEDVLGFIADIDAGVWSRAADPVIVRTGGSRGARVRLTTSMVADLIAQLGVSRTRQLFEPADRTKRLRALERSALTRAAVRQLDSLKGPLMKVAQHLSYAGWDTDPETDRQLAALRDHSAPVPTADIRAALRAELGLRAKRLIDTLSERPLGVGSIGQVHGAQLPDGTEVAVKVRFPGIRAAIHSDLAVLGLLVPVAHILRPKVRWRAVLDELRSTLLSECDYQREAVVQAAFLRHFAADPVIRVPRVFPDWCSDGVLTTERVYGTSLASFAEDAPYTERSDVAQALLRLLFGFVDDEYTFCDPHPGNFLVTDEHLVVLDFGCVQRWDPEHRLRWVRLGRAMMEADEAGMRRGIRELGFPVDPDHFDYEEYVQRFHTSFYTSAADEGGVPMLSASVVSQQLADFLSRKSVNYHNLQMPPELVFGLRAYYGTMYVLALLRTGVDSSSESFRAAVEATVAAAEARAS